jgi:hypothetical protein
MFNWLFMTKELRNLIADLEGKGDLRPEGIRGLWKQTLIMNVVSSGVAIAICVYYLPGETDIIIQAVMCGIALFLSLKGVFLSRKFNSSAVLYSVGQLILASRTTLVSNKYGFQHTIGYRFSYGDKTYEQFSDAQNKQMYIDRSFPDEGMEFPIFVQDAQKEITSTPYSPHGFEQTCLSVKQFYMIREKLTKLL